MYPVMLNVENRLCTVIGGGRVALRKTKKLAESGAKVRVIAKDFIDGFGEFETIRKPYESTDINNSFLVIAATDDVLLNRQIADDAKARNVLMSLADSTDFSDFISTASRAEGDITLAVSTSGKFPLLAKELCKIKSADLSSLSNILPLLEEYRKRIINGSGDNKKELLGYMLSDEMLEAAKSNAPLFRKKMEEKL